MPAWIARLYLAAGVVVAALVALRGHPPRPIPDYGLANEWVLRSEWFAVVLVVVLALGAVVVRGIVGGEVPSKVGRDSLEWEDAADKTAEGLESLRAVVKRQARRIEDHQTDLEAVVEELRRLSAAVDHPGRDEPVR
jgi:hypothetical protein